MKYIKKYGSFISEELVLGAPAPTTKPVETPTPTITPTKPGTRPAPPSVVPDRQQSDLPAPAKAELPTATADDVAARFIELINQQGDDIKKYVEME